MTAIRFEAYGEFDTASDALQFAEAGGGKAVLVANGTYVVSESELHRLEAAGVELAILHWATMPDGAERIVTIPVN